MARGLWSTINRAGDYILGMLASLKYRLPTHFCHSTDEIERLLWMRMPNPWVNDNKNAPPDCIPAAQREIVVQVSCLGTNGPNYSEKSDGTLQDYDRSHY